MCVVVVFQVNPWGDEVTGDLSASYRPGKHLENRLLIS